MGISAIFKRNKAVESSDGVVEAPKARHIKRRQTEPSYSSSKPSAIGRSRSSGGQAMRQAKSAETERRGTPLARRGTGRYAKAMDLSSESSMDELPTPDDSLDERSTRLQPRSKIMAPNSRAMVPATSRNDRSSEKRAEQANNDMLGMRSLRTPPLEAWAAQRKELDPFEDSPPRRPLTDFEDPTYIPPLTLAATLFDEYGGMGSVSATTGAASPAAAGASGNSHRTAAVGASTTMGQTKSVGSGSLDFFGEFNAAYSALFGSPPSATLTHSDGLLSPASPRSPKAHSDGLLSPASTHPSKTPSPVDETTSDDGQSESSVDSDSAGESTNGETPELVEERRKEEERRAAEQRSRRREVIKQQVAFERMKERHRKQRPEPAAAPFGSIARWQSEAAGATATGHTQASQNARYASTGAINRGYAAQPPHAGALGGAQYASTSMPSIARGADVPPAQRPPNFPLLVDTAAARAAAVPGGQRGHALASPVSAPPLLTNGGFHNAQGTSHPSSGFYTAPAAPYSSSGFHAAPLVSGPHPDMGAISPQLPIAAHPVRLASIPQSTKNAYLSDSSGDNDSDVSSLDASNRTSSNASVDAFYSAASSAATVSTTEARSAPVFASSITGGGMPRSALQRTTSVSRRIDALQAAGNDSSSEGSARSQSSSKRRVRFQETVSVVFNTHHSIAEDDVNCPSDSDNDSSNASVDISAAPRPQKMANGNGRRLTNSGVQTPGASADDDAFDDAEAIGHSRYHIPASVAVQVGALHWPDISATASCSSYQTSGASSRNGSPDGAKHRRQRLKHRVETQPLRDREAERELQLQKKLAATNHKSAAEPVEHRSSVDPAPASKAASELSTASEPTEESQAADPMTEARRALLGHYHVPNPMLPIGNSIPRSTTIAHSNSTALPRTSSVKVVRAQSLSRPQNRYSAGVAATQTKNDSWRGLRGPRRGQSVTSAHNDPSNVIKNNADQNNTGSAADHPTDHTPSAPVAKHSHTRLVSRTASSQDIARRDSHEFDFTNVLESFSASSFELFEGKEGGVHIRYSDKDNAHHKSLNASSEHLAEDAADESDGDDIPLSAIARSRSESAQKHSSRSAIKPLAANASALSHAIDTRQSNLQGRMLARNSGNFRTRGEDSGPISTDTRLTSTDAAHQQSTDTSKRRFTRWGNLF
ncbi:hypothetical protein H4R24_002279 [Coemansia sp. RSA 988]|nr:hypothetical protein H4R24_002279 [Coemansia sp. RSA 988]